MQPWWANESSSFHMLSTNLFHFYFHTFLLPDPIFLACAAVASGRHRLWCVISFHFSCMLIGCHSNNSQWVYSLFFKQLSEIKNVIKCFHVESYHIFKLAFTGKVRCLFVYFQRFIWQREIYARKGCWSCMNR